MIYLDNKRKNVEILITFIENDHSDTRAYRFLRSKMLLTTLDETLKTQEIEKKFAYLYESMPTIYTQKYQDKHLTQIYIQMPSENFIERKQQGDIIDLVKRLVFMRKSFNETDFIVEKKKLLQAIDNIKSDKFLYGEQLFLKFAFGYKNLESMPMYGSRKAIKHMTMDGLHQSYESLINAQKHIVINGYVHDSIYQKIMNLSSFQPIEKQEIIYKQRPVKVFKEKQVSLKMNQALIYLGYHVDAKAPDRTFFAMHIASSIIGGSSASRLFTIIREKYNLSYYISSGYYHTLNTMLVVASVERSSVDETIEKIEALIEDMKQKGITDKEFLIAKNEIKNQLIKQAEREDKHIFLTYNLAFYGDFENIDYKLHMIDSISIAEVEDMIKKMKLERRLVIKDVWENIL